MAHDLGARLADDVAGWLFVAGRIHEMANAKAEHIAVGQELIEVGVREAGWLFGLVLRIDYRHGLAVYAPDDVGFSTTWPASSR